VLGGCDWKKWLTKKRICSDAVPARKCGGWGKMPQGLWGGGAERGEGYSRQAWWMEKKNLRKAPGPQKEGEALCLGQVHCSPKERGGAWRRSLGTRMDGCESGPGKSLVKRATRAIGPVVLRRAHYQKVSGWVFLGMFGWGFTCSRQCFTG